MDMVENSNSGKKSAKLPVVGRPRIRPPGEPTVLSFKVEDELVRLLDEETEIMNREQPRGRSAISRGELVRLALYDWIEQRKKSRASKSRQ